MSAQVLTYIFVGLTFGLYIAIAIWSRSGSTKDFYVAGGHVHPLANGAATAADWMSAASYLSMAGIIARSRFAIAVLLRAGGCHFDEAESTQSRQSDGVLACPPAAHAGLTRKVSPGGPLVGSSHDRGFW